MCFGQKHDIKIKKHEMSLNSRGLIVLCKAAVFLGSFESASLPGIRFSQIVSLLATIFSIRIKMLGHFSKSD